MDMEEKMKELETLTLKYVREVHQRFDDPSIPSPNYGRLPKWGDGAFEWDHQRNLQVVLDLVRDNVELPGSRLATGRRMSPVTYCPTLAACLGAMLASTVSDYTREEFQAIEEEFLIWVRDVVGYPDDALGCMTSGGSMGVALSVRAARSALGVQKTDLQRTVVYMTEASHVSIEKALLIMGMREVKVHQVQMDECFRMNPSDLRQKIVADQETGLRPLYVLTTLGSTTAGAIDDIGTIAGIANQHAMWCHVDASIGGCCLQDETMKTFTKGLELTQSLNTSLSKGMSLTYGVGVFFIRHPIANSWQSKASSTVEDSSVSILLSNPMEDATTSSRRAFQACISRNLLGADFFRILTKKSLLQRQYLQELVQNNPDFQEIGKGECTTVVFGCEGDTTTQANSRTHELYRLLNEGGVDIRINLSSERHGLILCTCHHRITLKRLRELLQQIRKKMNIILGAPGPEFDEIPAMETILQEYDLVIKRQLDVTLNHDVPIALSKLCVATEVQKHSATGLVQYPTPQAAISLTITDGPSDMADMWTTLEDILTRQPHPQGPTAIISALGKFISHCICVMANVCATHTGGTQFEEKITQRLAEAVFMGSHAKGALYDDATTASIPGFMVLQMKAPKSTARSMVYIYGEPIFDVEKALDTVWLGEYEQKILTASDPSCLQKSLLEAIEIEMQNDKCPRLLIIGVNAAKKDPVLDRDLGYVSKCFNLARKYKIWCHLVIQHGINLLVRDHSNFQGLRGVMDSVTVDLTDPALHPSSLAAGLVADGDALISSLSTDRNVLAYVMNDGYDKIMGGDGATGESKIPRLEASMHEWIIELTRPIRSLPLWITLQLLGKAKASGVLELDEQATQ